MTLLLLLCLQDPLEPVTPPSRVDGAPLWLFAVDDGGAKPAVSCERDQKLFVGRLDLKSLRADWKEVARGVSDHWHIFAHGAHWLSYSTPEARKSHLLKLDKDFKQLGSWTVCDREQIPTNDHFLVAEPDGVTVGHFWPGRGHRLYRFSRDGKLKGKLDFGGGEFAHGNGSCAIPFDGGFRVLATETLNMVQQGGISWLDADASWKPKKIKLVLDEDRANIAMASGVVLADGSMILHARICANATPRGQMPPPPPEGQQGLADDSGAIVRYHVSRDGKVLSRKVLAEKGNRVHTALVGGLVLTTWDGPGGAKIAVDKLRK